MTTLTITRGYSGSGKTTLAKAAVAAAGFDGRPLTRVNRDDIRAMAGIPARGDWAQEQRVSLAQNAMVGTLLRSGHDVIVDDTNLVLRFARNWADLAVEAGADFHVIDVPVSLDECLRRNHARIDAGQRGVPDEVIRNQAERFPISQWRPIEAREGRDAKIWTPYAPPTGPGLVELIYLVDIDGTVAKKRMDEGSRGWHEYERVAEDLPNPGVIDVVQDLRRGGHRIVFMSGRKDYCREQTRRWLQHYLGDWTLGATLHMRADDDNRSDDLVKHELFHKHIQGKYVVRGVLDDRDRVVAMWRAIGLTVLQVDYGNF